MSRSVIMISTDGPIYTSAMIIIMGIDYYSILRERLRRQFIPIPATLPFTRWDRMSAMSIMMAGRICSHSIWLMRNIIGRKRIWDRWILIISGAWLRRAIIINTCKMHYWSIVAMDIFQIWRRSEAFQNQTGVLLPCSLILMMMRTRTF